MIKSIPDLIEYVNADMRSKGVNRRLRSFIFDPVFRFTVLLRVNEYLENSGKPFPLRVLPLLWYRRLSIRLGFSVPTNVFDAGLAIVHYGLLIVNPSAKIGRNCRVHAGVNIGAAAGFTQPGDTSRRAPVIGHNCYIGPGAKIFGPVTIGNCCVIGANAVVNKSFELDNVTLGGIPARVIAENGSQGKVKPGAAVNAS